MPAGQPPSCPEPSGSPLIDSWTPPVETTTTTTTTESPEDSLISIPSSGSVCGLELIDPEFHFDCVPYSVTNNATQACFGIIRYFDCYTQRYQSIISTPGDCYTIYSHTEPELTFNSCGNDQVGGDPGDPENPQGQDPIEPIIIEPVECDIPPDDEDEDEGGDSGPDITPEPSGGNPNPIPEPSGNPPTDPPPELPPDAPTPSGVTPDGPTPASSNIKFIIIGESGPNALVPTEINSFSQEVEQVRACPYNAPLAYVNGSPYHASMRKDTNYYLPYDNSNNPYPADVADRGEYNFDQSDAFRKFKDSPVEIESNWPNVGDEPVSIILNSNEQDILGKERFVNKVNVIVSIYDGDTQLHKVYIIPPIDTDVPAANMDFDSDGGTGQIATKNGLTLERDGDFRQATISPVNEASLKTAWEAWPAQTNAWFTKQSVGRLVSNRMIGWDMLNGVHTPGVTPLAQFVQMAGAQSPNTSVPLGHTWLEQYDVFTRVTDGKFPDLNRESKLINPVGLRYQDSETGFAKANLGFLQESGLQEVYLNTYFCSYITAVSFPDMLITNLSNFSPNFFKGEAYIPISQGETGDIFFRDLEVPLYRAENFILKHALIGRFANGSMADITAVLYPGSLPLATAESVEVISGSCYKNLNTGSGNGVRKIGETNLLNLESVGNAQLTSGWRVQKVANSYTNDLAGTPDDAKYENSFGPDKSEFAEIMDTTEFQVIRWDYEETMYTSLSAIANASGLPIIPSGVNTYSTADFMNSIRG